ncbi:calcium-translocating P-type ATPase, PMCA-type [Halostagnicola sp. A-GB9-2]|uniref:calcium-translocating P-type ATPase, PMCA-type n=1 Tax=Halostagnicola sp. A-GB9-2 TaxID=3048066 RepID=UPI0024BF8A3D|nr:calcium-translocating P-type ATPase, PMCA-type [Halostagnicola sp. A-GB9-2]MDJ1434252.1 calcium-translocating P-type ATPase, PMCA-type [Halostagnicola sp. A-GB9-2]
MSQHSSADRSAETPSVTETDERWHAISLENIYKTLETFPGGLDDAEARQRLARYGRNELVLEDKISPLRVFLEQYTSALIWLLVVAAAVMLFVGHYFDAGVILAIVVLITLFGFVQDYRAEQSIAALRELATTDATVLRNGERTEIDARNVVPGDVTMISAGDAVPADGRLLSESNLSVDESALTGESMAVSKRAAALADETALAERRNMVYKDTVVTRGSAMAVVVETGSNTEMGSIARALESAQVRKTPFQTEMDQLGKSIGVGVVLAVGVIVVAELLVGETDPLTIFLTAVSLAVSAVPEGLPAVVTLSLALGARRMAAKNALVRRLSIVESLGSVDVICTDKTGTLTEEEMTVQRVYAGDDVYGMAGSEHEVVHGTSLDEGQLHLDCVAELFRCGLLCNDTDVGRREGGERSYLGDPTEVALFVAAQTIGIDPDACRRRYPRVDGIEFTSERKRMTTVHETPDDETVAYVKGAPEVILERCDRELIDGEVRPLSTERRSEVHERIETFAGDALRVLGFAYRAVDDVSTPITEEIETDLVFLGLQGMLDPPRPEVPAAIEGCQAAGIRVVMITGDNAITARAIGDEVGLSDQVLTGSEVSEMEGDELRQALHNVDVFARAAPEHKVRILQTLQEMGHTVAMTGDGVNDAPAVKNADVGIAMGIRGTDVTEQASDIVLLDDNFATIRNAVREGRRIFDNVRKFVNYLLSGNAGEVLLVFTGAIAGLGLVITPIQILWINLVTDGAPALTIGVDPEADDVMERSPRPIDESVITDRIATSIVGIAVFMTVTILPLFYVHRANLELAQTMVFTSFVLFEMVRIQAIRWRYNLGLLSNPWLVIAVVVTLALQLVILYTPIGVLFGVVPLEGIHWLQIGTGVVAFVVLMLLFVRIQDQIFDRY